MVNGIPGELFALEEAVEEFLDGCEQWHRTVKDGVMFVEVPLIRLGKLSGAYIDLHSAIEAIDTIDAAAAAEIASGKAE